MNDRKGFRRGQRLKASDIAALSAGGRVLRHPGFTAVLKPNSLGVPRFTVIVPKRIMPRAVDRNRMKRRLREWLRNHQELLGAQDVSVRVSGKSLLTHDLAKIFERS